MGRSKPKVVARKNEVSSVIQAIGEDLAKYPGSNVFVVGAGASAPAGVPTSRALKKDLTKWYSGEMVSKLNERRDERGEPRYNDLDEVAFEVLLPIYAEIVQRDNAIEEFLRGHLERFLGEKRFPPLGYEVLAHFLNHGLIKNLVSMNFDELLELALDEELGDQNYEKARSLSQFAKLLDDDETGQEREKMSERKILLKPHGTISLSATLRIELQKVFLFEKEKADVLEKVLRGKNVIFVGYNFLDPDLQKLVLHLVQSKRLKKVYFVHSNEAFPSKNDYIKELFSSSQDATILTCVLIHKDSDEFFEQLALAIEKTEEGGYLPKITRHRMRNLIFQKGGFDPTLQNKLLVELLIFALKVKGKFKIKSLLSCERIKYHTMELIRRRRESDVRASSVYIVLRKLQDEGILLIEEDKNDKVCDIGDEVCYLIGSTMEKEEQEEQVVKKEVITNIMHKLPSLLGKPDTTLDNTLSNLMNDLVEEFDYDLFIGLHPFEFSFESPDHKEDSIEFRKRLIAKDILESVVDEQETCYVIAETGEWLLKETVSKDTLKSNSVRIILSHYQKDPLNSLHRARANRVHKQLVAKCKPNTQIGFLDWDLNKHHGTFSQKRCIYFYKEGKPSTLQPLELTSKADTERVMKLCDYLWKMCDK